MLDLEPQPVQPATAVAVVEPAPDEWERSLEPRSTDEARVLAKWLHESRMFSAYGTPQGILSTILLGRELGLPTMAALRSVHIIEGKHSLSADLMVALGAQVWGWPSISRWSSPPMTMCTIRDEAFNFSEANAHQLHHR